MLSAWPQVRDEWDSPAEAKMMDDVMDMIRSIRNLRAGMNVQPGHRAQLMVHPSGDMGPVLMSQENAFRRLAGVSTLSILPEDKTPEGNTVTAVCAAGEYFIPLGELVDIAAELKRLTKEKDRLLDEIRRGEGKLSNAGFVAKAPQQLVEAEKQKILKNREMLATLENRIGKLHE